MSKLKIGFGGLVVEPRKLMFVKKTAKWRMTSYAVNCWEL